MDGACDWPGASCGVLLDIQVRVEVRSQGVSRPDTGGMDEHGADRLPDQRAEGVGRKKQAGLLQKVLS